MSMLTLSRRGWSSRVRAVAGALMLSLAAMPAQAAIVINEVDADQAGTDAAEFVELYNTGASPVTLTDYVLVFFNGSNDLSYFTLALGSLTVPAGGFVVIGNTGVPSVSTVTFAGNFLQNGQDAVALYSGVPTAAGFPNSTPVGTPPAGAVLVDAVVYDTADADDSTLIAALTPGQPQIDEGAGGPGGGAETNSISRVPDGGTPLVTTTFVAKSPTPGASNGSAVGAVLTLDVTPSAFPENSAPGTVTGTVTRTGSTAAALTVTLTSANPDEATVPVSVTIAIGATQQTFAVTAVDELVSDGNKTFNISAAATGFTTVTKSITVQDNEVALPPLELSFDVTTLTEGSTVAAGTVSRPSSASLPAITITLTSSNPAEATTDVASVVIPADTLTATFSASAVDDAIYSPNVAVIITASATGFANGTATLNVTDNDSPPSFGPPTVVVNKFSNTSPDLIELLVTGNGTPGTTVDMRRMVVKDFASSMGTDGGKGFRFTDAAIFSSVKVGTLMVLANSSTSADVTYANASDFSLSFGLTDPIFFTPQAGGAFDISSTEMVMIKRQDAEIAGVAGSIHVLASGAAGAQFNLAPEYKLIASSTSATNRGVIAVNSTGSLADFNGTDATGNVPLDAAAFGIANDFATGGPNFTYIRTLRGVTNINGLGFISGFSNATSGSPYAGVNIFPRNATGQVVAFTLTGTNSGTLTALRITVPTAFGTVTNPANVSVAGTGAGTPAISFAGQVVTISGVAITGNNPVNIALSGLITPNPTAVTDEPNYPFALLTSEAGTVFASTGLTPAAAVLIPISALRDVDAAGVPLDLGKIIAIEGICTEAQFSANAAGDTTAFFQDGDFGLGLFASATPLNLVRGNRYALTGPFSQFNGLSQISLPVGSGANVIDRGVATEVTPVTLTLAELFANAESYEGRLVKVLSLGNPTGNWQASSTVTLTDAAATAIQVRIQAGSAATSPPASFPANITGILSQFDSSNPYTAFYQLQPREPGDLEIPTAPSGYSAWAANYPNIGGAENDADGDGQSNYLEYALGTIPNDRTSSQALAVSVIRDRPALSITKGSEASVDVNVFYQIEGSSDLVNWVTPTSPNSPLEIDVNNSTTYTVRYLPATPPRYYFRLKVGPPPVP